MLILVAIILGFLIGKIRRGSLHGFKVRKISLLPLGILGLLLQLALHFYNYTGGIPLIEPYLEIVNFASYILVLVMLVFNLDDFWVILMAIGFTSNFVVIFINGGRMPVAQAVIDILPTGFAQQIVEGLSPIYTLIQPNTLLWFLGINLPIPIPFLPTLMSFYGTVAGVSVGTLVALVGFVGFIQYVMNKKPSIMSDENQDYIEDEGIFGEGENQSFDNVSIQSNGDTGQIPAPRVEDFYQDIASGGAIRGERDESMTTVISEEQLETMVIPDVREKDLSEIGTETEEIIVQKQAPEETMIIDAADDGSTKVIGNIQEVGTFVSGDENKGLEASEMEEILKSEDTGFFTKKYYEEKLAVEKERLKLQLREMELNKVAESMREPAPKPEPESDLRIVESFKLTELDRPFVLRGDNPHQEVVVSKTEDDEEEFSEGEMMNVWQRLNLEDEKRKAQRRKQTIKESSIEADNLLRPSSRNEEIAIPLKEIEEVTEDVVEDSNGNRENMSDDQRKTFNETLEERKKAGYELVELKLDGKDVAFWRKKK
ncbi:DUF5317 family protein [Acetobacterium bakii]|uniref:DUF5317 family protein n=1 Tax=Acetobacterium bakii TaxID=52689 RepID=UPI000B12C1B5|nr:DUF5317 family protein [Acetobacterium bakii]